MVEFGDHFFAVAITRSTPAIKPLTSKVGLAHPRSEPEVVF